MSTPVSALKNVVNSLVQYRVVFTPNQSGNAVTPNAVSRVKLVQKFVLLLTRPDDTLINRAIRSLEESTCLDAIVERRVVVVGNGRVDHDDVGLLSLVQSRNQLPHLVQGEALWISGEDMPGVHVIDISPWRVSASILEHHSIQYSHMTSRGISAAL